MKLIFIALLLGNIAFFLTQLFGGSAPSQVESKKVNVREYGNLQTLAEREAKNKSVQKLTEKRESASEASMPERECQLIGPFVELLHAEYLVERLGALEVAAAIKHIEIVDGKNYLVYLKPEMSEKEALRRLYEIQAKSIDSYIIPQGELANGISLGQFSDAAAAKEKSDRIREQGYAPEIKEVPKTHNEIWVEVKEKAGQKINADQWQGLLKEEKAIERRENYCLGVANP